MTTKWTSVVIMAAALAGWMTSARAQSDQPPVDPAAIDALEKMSAYVAGLDSFELNTTYSFDMVAGNSQNVTMDGTGHYLVKRPDKLFVSVENDLFSRDYVYDGKTLTVVSPVEKYFSVAEAKPMTKDMLADAANDLGILIPLADLFDLGTPDSPIKSIKSAFLVGSADIDGVATQHWALQGPERDWEIWIADGDKPLPLKVTIADPGQETMPRYVTTIKWSVPGTIPDNAFSFQPSADMKSIGFVRGAPQEGAK